LVARWIDDSEPSGYTFLIGTIPVHDYIGKSKIFLIEEDFKLTCCIYIMRSMNLDGHFLKFNAI
jgi:hypothetical protein